MFAEHGQANEQGPGSLFMLLGLFGPATVFAIPSLVAP
jgi:hypothetical protein